ncbi:hypothetical protein FOA52_011245 [Chlamydomonas sp. UWO 241]|nr:hypothetical protein FOA52_011245 [Chlamydomonas sp. UWO 241]
MATGAASCSGRPAAVHGAGHRRPLGVATSALAGRPSESPVASSGTGAGNGTFALMLLCVVVFVADHVLHLPAVAKYLYLHNYAPSWWQYVTHQFCHGSLEHLSSNLFQLCVFGRFVEETEGTAGVVFIFLITGLGAAAASALLMPGGVSVGASGAIFGLFATSVLLRLTRPGGPGLKSLLEAAVLGNFVVRQVMQEMKHQASGGLSMQGMQVAHIAHLGGALAVSTAASLEGLNPEDDAVLVALRELALQAAPVGAPSGTLRIERDAAAVALQEDLQLAARIKDASEALAYDVSGVVSEYRQWSMACARRAASKQEQLHAVLDETEARAVEAGAHVARLVQHASGVSSQLDALADLPRQVELLCAQVTSTPVLTYQRLIHASGFDHNV